MKKLTDPDGRIEMLYQEISNVSKSRPTWKIVILIGTIIVIGLSTAIGYSFIYTDKSAESTKAVLRAEDQIIIQAVKGMTEEIKGLRQDVKTATTAAQQAETDIGQHRAYTEGRNYKGGRR